MKFILLTLIMFFAPSAYADCAMVPDKDIEATIEKIYAPLHFADGRHARGCLLKADGKVLGVATDPNLCNIKPGSKLPLRLSYGCCDTGRDSGDFSCVVRTKGKMGVLTVHGNGVIVKKR